jgi:putative FmdB family regulatory protein
MPIYAYACEDCGHAQDFLQKISDPLIDSCPSCGSKSFRKQLTAAGFQLKGGGWYVTDFRDNGKKDAKKPADGKAAEGGGADSGDGAKAEGKGDAKTETKADAKSDGKGDTKAGGKSEFKSDSKAAAPAPTAAPAAKSPAKPDPKAA